ncbi:MAG: C40 family peptidase [Bacteroidales bacterium]|nr:C40 family peptidase [Bacteroidales bacterium]
MSFGICDLPVIPIRKGGSHTSEMTSQLLFNELYEVLDEIPQWTLIRTEIDHYEGWIQGIQHHPISDQEYLTLKAKPWHIINRPVFNHQGTHLSMGTILYEPNDYTMPFPDEFSPTAMIDFAKRFLGSPYLWGGRSLFGIDCSGFVQLCARAAGKLLPRDASQQVKEGDLVYFLTEIQPGDLAFFGDEEGKIVHVGMMIDAENIIHASGKVRIDYLDQTGIFNRDRNEHTHWLKVIKRIS